MWFYIISKEYKSTTFALNFSNKHSFFKPMIKCHFSGWNHQEHLFHFNIFTVYNDYPVTIMAISIYVHQLMSPEFIFQNYLSSPGQMLLYFSTSLFKCLGWKWGNSLKQVLNTIQFIWFLQLSSITQKFREWIWIGTVPYSSHSPSAYLPCDLRQFFLGICTQSYMKHTCY